jgi:hypothetical protein
MMRSASLTSVIAIGVFLAAVEPTSAQPLFAHAESIESTVVNADLVFIAKLVKLGDATQVDGLEVHAATIAIERTLKQEIYNDESYELLQVRIARSAAVLTDWIERSCRLLVLLKDDAPYANTVIELVPGKMEVLKADFTLLREPEEVIRAAAESLRRMSPAVKRVHTFALRVPLNHVAKTRWAEYHGLTLDVPVDEQLEKRAVEYLRSENYLEREQAVRALRYFKSDENISQVEAMLNDPGWAYLHHPQENNGIEVRLYGVRDAAYKTLKSWGMDVDKPMIREEIVRSPG